jgi:hypothetical protein
MYPVMDPIWTQLPIDLVNKICNMLILVRRIPDDMKRDIEMQEMKLNNFFKSSRVLFGLHTWTFVFNSLCLYVSEHNLFEISQEWSPRDESYYIWNSMTPEEREADHLRFEMAMEMEDY